MRRTDPDRAAREAAATRGRAFLHRVLRQVRRRRIRRATAYRRSPADVARTSMPRGLRVLPPRRDRASCPLHRQHGPCARCASLTTSLRSHRLPARRRRAVGRRSAVRRRVMGCPLVIEPVVSFAVLGIRQELDSGRHARQLGDVELPSRPPLACWWPNLPSSGSARTRPWAPRSGCRRTGARWRSPSTGRCPRRRCGP